MSHSHRIAAITITIAVAAWSLPAMADTASDFTAADQGPNATVHVPYAPPAAPRPPTFEPPLRDGPDFITGPFQPVGALVPHGTVREQPDIGENASPAVVK